MWPTAAFQGRPVAHTHFCRVCVGVSDDAFMVGTARSVHNHHPPVAVPKISTPHRLRIPLVLWRRCHRVVGRLHTVAASFEIGEPPFEPALIFMPSVSVPGARVAIFEQIASTNPQT